MNREQRRAQRRANLQQVNKIETFDLTKGNLKVNIKDSDEFLVVDLLDFDVTNAIFDMYNKFSNIEAAYKEEYNKAMQSNKLESKFMLLRHIVYDFSEMVDSIFGNGACVLLFGHKHPQLVQITEFIEDFGPIATEIMNATNSTMTELSDMQDASTLQHSNVVPME